MSSTTPKRTGIGRTFRTSAAGLGLAFLAFSALPAAAEVQLPSAPGVAVGGDLTNHVGIGSTATSSDGQGAQTSLRVNEVDRSRARGSITNTAEIGDLTLRAQGRNAVSETVIGTIEDVEAGGSIGNGVSIGSSLNITVGAGARACTEIGTMRRATCR